jgi:hypothetical protein
MNNMRGTTARCLDIFLVLRQSPIVRAVIVLPVIGGKYSNAFPLASKETPLDLISLVA